MPFPRSLQQPGLGECYASTLGESVADLDAKRSAVLALLRDLRAQKARTNDPDLREQLRVAEVEAVGALSLLAQAANAADQPALWVRAANAADDAVRAMGNAIREVVLAIGDTTGQVAGAVTKPLLPALWPIALGLVAAAYIWKNSFVKVK